MRSDKEKPNVFAAHMAKVFTSSTDNCHTDNEDDEILEYVNSTLGMN